MDSTTRIRALSGLVPTRDVIASTSGLRVILSHVDAYQMADEIACDLVTEFRALRPSGMSDGDWHRLANVVHQGGGPPAPVPARLAGKQAPTIDVPAGAGPRLTVRIGGTQSALVPEAHSPRARLSYGDPAWVWARLSFELASVPNVEELQLIFQWDAIDVRQHDVTVSGIDIHVAARSARDLFGEGAASDPLD